MREHQLLELLLTYAIPRKDVNPIAHELINRYGTLAEVLKADITELSKIDGIGENAAILISVCGAMRNIREKPKKRPRLGTPQASCKYCIELLRTQRYETTYAISLDSGMRPLHADVVSTGTIDQNMIYPRLVVECALRHGAANVILCHNHPSGNPGASPGAVNATKAVCEALASIGIRLHDHIIVAGEHAYSMARDIYVPPELENKENEQK